MSLRNTLSPILPGGRAESYELCLLFTYRLVLVIGNYTAIFRFFFLVGVQGERVTWEDFSWGKGIFHEGGARFPSII
jgi:hypothetical protein